MAITVRLTSNRLPALAAALPAAVSRAVGDTAAALSVGWKARTHVVTGRLRASIAAQHAGGALTATVSTSVPYAAEEQLVGNRQRPPHPAPVPAAEAERPLFTRRVRTALERLA